MLTSFDSLDFGGIENPFVNAVLFPAIGTSDDISKLYYGLRSRGFGLNGIRETSNLWESIKDVCGLEDVLASGFGENFLLNGECWIAYAYLDIEDLDLLATNFVDFIRRLINQPKVQ
jgi:hypothetical protein